MSFSEVNYSSNKQDWPTPQAFFDNLNAEFNFTLDAAASHSNAKCSRYYTEAEDGLAQDWGTETVWLNPPYDNVKAWVKKAYEASQAGATVVCLTFSRTDTRWFHDHVYHKAELRFVKGRLKFGEDTKHVAPAPSVVIVYRPPQPQPEVTPDA